MGLRRVLLATGLLVPLSVAAFAAAPDVRGDSPIRWQSRVEVASGDAFRGPWRMNESRFHYVDDPTVAISDAGDVAVAWVDQRAQNIQLQVYEAEGGTRFDRPVNVSRSPDTFSWLPRLVVDGEDARRVYVLWQEIVFSGGSHGGEIFFARSTDGGRTFAAPINLSNTIAGAGKGRLTEERWDNGSLDLAAGPEGTLYAAWTEYQGRLHVSRSTDGGRSFSEPQHVAGDGEAPARGPSLAVDGDAVYVVWTVGERADADIHIARSTDAGRTFGSPKRVTGTGGHSDAPKIAVDGRGTLHVVYAESPAGPFRRSHIRYTRSDDAGRTFTSPKTIAGPRRGRVESMGFPHLELDGEDNLYLLWELYPSEDARPRGLAFTHSTDRGRSFARPSAVPGTLEPALGFNGSQQGLLMDKLAVNESGAVAVVNSTFRPRRASHVWLVRGRSSLD